MVTIFFSDDGGDLLRLWSLHPKYLDSKGIVALWREGLLAKAVLEGKTKGYNKHPQLQRFISCLDPLAAINFYLNCVLEEAIKRGYNFDRTKIDNNNYSSPIFISSGQLEYEWRHLMNKLYVRNNDLFNLQTNILKPKLHPLFKVKKGPPEKWETIKITS